MTALATYSTATGVSGVDPRVALGHSEPLAVGVKRVTLDELERAASGFFDGEDEFAGAVHQSRKSMKRVRSLLRLVRGEITERVFEYEDRSIRDTGRLLSEVRSSVATTDAAVLIRDLYGELLAPSTFEELIGRLGHRRDLIELRALEDPHLIGRVVHNLEKAYNRYAAWSTDPDARTVYGLGIRNEYVAVEPGLYSTYERGRREMVAAYKTRAAHEFHQWRKRAKYLRHQVEFLTPLWPEVVVGLAVTLDRLGELLGEEHDLAELLELLHSRPDMCPSPRERSLFAALVTQRRSELQVAAEILGRRIYAEAPDSVQHRFGEYWESRQMALAAPLDTVVVY